MGVIYKITSPSGNVYIGQSINFKARYWYYQHLKCIQQPILYRSLCKYGFDNHKIEIICELPDNSSPDDLDKMEIFYWQLYKDQGIVMLNCREPGRAGRFNAESIEKRRKHLIGRKLSEEHRQKIIEINRSEEQRKIRSIKLEQHNVSEETLTKQSEKLKLAWKEGKFNNRKKKCNTFQIGCKPVETYDCSGNLLNKYSSCKECAEDLKIKANSIRTYINTNKIICGRSFKYG